MHRGGPASAVHPPARVLIAHPGAELYGSDRVMLETITAFRDAGCSVLVTVPEDGPLLDEIRARGADAEIRRSLVIRKSLLSPTGLVRLVTGSVAALVSGIRLMRRERPGLLVANTLTIPIWTFAARLCRVPVLVHVHEAERTARPMLRRLLCAPLRLAQLVIVNSNFTLDVIAESVPSLRSRSRVVYNAVPGPASVTAASTGPRLSVLYLGRLSPRKGVDLVLDAVAELRDRGLDARLDVVGDVFVGYEWYREELHERSAARDLAGAIVFHGFQPDVWPFIAASDVVVVPSRLDEPFGNTAVEAILSARPVIASDSSGLREAAGGYASAQLVPPDDADAIADALQRITDDRPGYARDALADRLIAEERHGPSQYREGMVHAARTAGILP